MSIVGCFIPIDCLHDYTDRQTDYYLSQGNHPVATLFGLFITYIYKLFLYLNDYCVQ